MKTINAILMIDPASPTGHYYLEYLHASGYRLKTILVFKKGMAHDIKSFRKKIKRLLSKKHRITDKKLNKIKKGINDQFTINIKKTYNYRDYCDELVYINALAEGPNSQEIIEFIERSDTKYVIFSGGGILRKKILSINHKQFIHVHPGIVPDIRGADCFFWSVLEKGKPGYSCFYMTPEIDEGAILLRKEYDLPNLELLKSMPQELSYKAILDSLDLHYRAECLTSLMKQYIGSSGNLENLTSIQQNPNDGRTYFFMHTKLIYSKTA